MTKLTEDELDILIDLHMKITRDLNGLERDITIMEKRVYLSYLGSKYGFDPEKIIINTKTGVIMPLPDNFYK